MNEGMDLLPFEQKFPVEILMLNGEWLFNARDVAKGLYLSESQMRDAIAEMPPGFRILVTNEMIRKCSSAGSTGIRKMANRGESFLPVPGLVQITLQSRKPEARDFQYWISGEVVPSLISHGVYVMPSRRQDIPALPQSYSEALRALADEVDRRVVAEEGLEKANQQLKAQAPIIDYYKAVCDAGGSISVAEMAKLLSIPGLGEYKLFRFLVERKILFRQEGHYFPYQTYLDRGHFIVREKLHKRDDGSVIRYTQTRILPKGAVAIAAMIKGKALALEAPRGKGE
jgi:anti-repressor protein